MITIIGIGIGIGKASLRHNRLIRVIQGGQYQAHEGRLGLHNDQQTQWDAVCGRHVRHRAPCLGAKSGSVDSFTKEYGLKTLVYAERHADIADAIHRGKCIKH